jgi:hypothetical protein
MVNWSLSYHQLTSPALIAFRKVEAVQLLLIILELNDWLISFLAL